jgi:transcription elongation factor Elf1
MSNNEHTKWKEHTTWFACPKCHAGALKLIKETLNDDEPVNQCTHCKARFKIYLEDVPNGDGEELKFVEVDREVVE